MGVVCLYKLVSSWKQNPYKQMSAVMIPLQHSQQTSIMQNHKPHHGTQLQKRLYS